MAQNLPVLPVRKVRQVRDLILESLNTYSTHLDRAQASPHRTALSAHSRLADPRCDFGSWLGYCNRIYC